MTLRSIQLRRLAEAILQSDLSTGKKLSTNRFVRLLTTRMVTEATGDPIFNMPKAYRHQKINLDLVNKGFLTINEDLNVLYESILLKSQQIMYDFIAFESLRRKVERRTREVGTRANNIILMRGDNTLLSCISESFTDMTHININDSTCEINVDQGSVKLPHSGSSILRLPTSHMNQQVRIITPIGAIPTETNTLTEALDGNINTFWRYNVSKLRATTGAIEITLYGGALYGLSILEIAQHSPKMTKINVSLLTHAGWLSLPTQDVTDIARFEFDTVDVAGVKIILAKMEPDEIVNGYDVFHFGLRNIGFYKSVPAESAILVSEAWETDYPIDKVAIEVESEVPAGTSINYFIATEEDQWFPISPIDETLSQYPNLISFEQIPTIEDEELSFGSTVGLIEANTQPPHDENLHSIRSNVSFYKYDLANGPVLPSTISLKRGAWTWRVQQQDITQVDPNYLPRLLDWSTITDEPKYLPVGDTQWILYNYTAGDKYWRLDIDFIINETITPMQGVFFSSHPSAVYLNDTLIKSSSQAHTEVLTYRFKPGVNRFTILLYEASATATSLSLGINLEDIADECFASYVPMKQIDLVELQYKILNSEHNVYAYDSLQNCIVVNRYLPGLTHEVSYRYNDGSVNTLYFKAELNRNAEITNRTPTLKGYRIRLS